MIIASIDSVQSLESYQKAGAGAVIVSIPRWSIRNNTVSDLSEIPDWKRRCKALGLQLAINMQAFIMEEDLADLKQDMQFLKEYADFIYYGDEGALQTARELGMEERMVYQPETLVTSSLDARFYMDLGIASVCLAHELSLDEVQAILAEVPGAEVLVHGYVSILYSRRPLISNYLEQIHSSASLKPYQLVEQTRKEAMPVVQSSAGTFIFSPAPKKSIDQIRLLEQSGCSRFRIDNLFLGDEETAGIIQAYADALSGKPAVPPAGDDSWYFRTSLKRKEG